jgi:hypothetical protein
MSSDKAQRDLMNNERFKDIYVHASQLDFGHSRWIASEVGQSVQHGTRHFDGI